jgi:hypothetical protein
MYRQPSGLTPRSVTPANPAANNTSLLCVVFAIYHYPVSQVQEPSIASSFISSTDKCDNCLTLCTGVFMISDKGFYYF